MQGKNVVSLKFFSIYTVHNLNYACLGVANNMPLKLKVSNKESLLLENNTFFCWGSVIALKLKLSTFLHLGLLLSGRVLRWILFNMRLNKTIEKYVGIFIITIRITDWQVWQNGKAMPYPSHYQNSYYNFRRL